MHGLHGFQVSLTIWKGRGFYGFVVLVVLCRVYTSANQHTGTDSSESAAENEKHKQDQLSKSKDGNNHWKPELASNSEEAVCCTFYSP